MNFAYISKYFSKNLPKYRVCARERRKLHCIDLKIIKFIMLCKDESPRIFLVGHCGFHSFSTLILYFLIVIVQLYIVLPYVYEYIYICYFILCYTLPDCRNEFTNLPETRGVIIFDQLFSNVSISQWATIVT